MQSPSRPRGFTLVELTVVLIIISLLLGGLLLPLSAQQDIKNQSAAEKQLAEIKEALVGYAIINGRLPCPMDDTAGITIASANYGKAGTYPADCNRDGILPWKDLGVPETDPWGQKRNTDADPYTGYWRYRLHPNLGTAFTAATEAKPTPINVYRTGTTVLQHTTDEPPVLIVYSTGPDRAPNARNAAVDQDYDSAERSQTFDDLTLWISRPALYARLAAAGKLAP